MVELTFPSGVPMAPFKFTTGVKVVPDVEPFKDWRPDGKCRGRVRVCRRWRRR